MIKIGDMLEQPEIQKMKRESIYALSKEKNIQEFLKTYHLNTSIMDDYWVEFLDYNDDYQLCQGCQSLQNCRKDNQGTVSYTHLDVYKRQELNNDRLYL